MARKNFGRVRHSPRKVAALAWRGGRGRGRRGFNLRVSISRHGVIVNGRGKFSAVICLPTQGKDAIPLRTGRRGGPRCGFASGSTPTSAFKAALRALSSKVR